MGKASARSISADRVGTFTRNRTVTESIKQDALAANLVGSVRIKDSLILKASLGVGHVWQKSRGQATGQTFNSLGQSVASDAESRSHSSTQWAPVMGLGAGYQINEDWQVNLNWRRFTDLKPDMLGRMDIDLFTLGVQYRF